MPELYALDVAARGGRLSGTQLFLPPPAVPVEDVVNFKKAVLFALWIVTWTETKAKLQISSSRREQWFCVEERRSQVFDSEAKALAEVASRKVDGYRDVKIWKAEPGQ